MVPIVRINEIFRGARPGANTRKSGLYILPESQPVGYQYSSKYLVNHSFDNAQGKQSRK